MRFLKTLVVVGLFALPLAMTGCEQLTQATDPGLSAAEITPRFERKLDAPGKGPAPSDTTVSTSSDYGVGFP